ncbi:hypothetical protein L1887_06974 [Cichorium endivia]|nr:hypothetical protein L1887_06974 [Cichorium endivia]
MLYRLHSIHHTSHSCILIVHFLDQFQSHNGLRLLGSSFISDFRFNCRSDLFTRSIRIVTRFDIASIASIAELELGFHEDKKEQEITARNAAIHQQKADAIKNIIVMDPSMDVTSDDVPVNEPVPTTVEFEEILHASSQVIQSEEQFDDEVQSPQVVPKGPVRCYDFFADVEGSV